MILWFNLSAMNTLPSRSTAIPIGLFSREVPAPPSISPDVVAPAITVAASVDKFTRINRLESVTYK